MQKQKRLWATSALLLLALLLAACGGGDDNDDGDSEGNDDTNQQTPVAEGTEVSVLPNDYDISFFPQARIVRASQNLTLVSYSVMQTNGTLYLMYLVRNDSEETIENIAALVTLLDENDFRLTDYRLTSSYVNIVPSQVVPLLGVYPIPVGYDGLATLIIRSGSRPFDGFVPHWDATATAEFFPDTESLQGTAVNNSDKALVQPVGYFVLTDGEGNLISTVPALIEGLDEQAMWQPGATLNLNATVMAYAGDLAEVTQTQLIVAGYERTERTTQP